MEKPAGLPFPQSLLKEILKSLFAGQRAGQWASPAVLKHIKQSLGLSDDVMRALQQKLQAQKNELLGRHWLRLPESKRLTVTQLKESLDPKNIRNRLHAQLPSTQSVKQLARQGGKVSRPDVVETGLRVSREGINRARLGLPPRRIGEF